MSDPETPFGGVRLRLVAAVVALGAGVVAIIVAILLVKTALA
jgi:thiamine monophosphate synthase